ncbi:MAG: hypothetical protein KGO96_10335 [Elusimicrobia bacterium]|nr:hypothetical protein [Elusimicrobiota bacterium]
MPFNWPVFFDRYGIPYEEGRRGWLSIWCQWCGGPGTHHMGVSTKSGGYHCWHGHSGISPHRLIVALLGCSQAEANSIVGSDSGSFVRGDDTFAADSLARLGIRQESAQVSNAEFLTPLPEFSRVTDMGFMCRKLAMPYLKSRGYGRDDALRLAERYGLMFASTGPFAYRIIVPVIEDGLLVNWTGRTVASSDNLRYKSLSTDVERAERQGLPPAVKNIKDVLLDIDRLRKGGRTLVVTEGPFDALRVGFLGKRRGIRATCLFGKVPTDAQLGQLHEIVPRFDDAVVLLDRDAGLESFLSLPEHLGIRRMELPGGASDPAELTERQFSQLFSD